MEPRLDLSSLASSLRTLDTDQAQNLRPFCRALRHPCGFPIEAIRVPQVRGLTQRG